jgi:hypothetical protein
MWFGLPYPRFDRIRMITGLSSMAKHAGTVLAGISHQPVAQLLSAPNT